MFIEDPVELGARIVRGALRRARTFRDRQNPFAFPHEYLYERYRFLAEGITYIASFLSRMLPMRHIEAVHSQSHILYA